MANEQDMYDELVVKNLSAAFTRNQFDFTAVNTKEDAFAFLKERLTRELKIGFGGSRTLEEIGIIDYLVNGEYPHLLNRVKKGITPDEKARVERETFSADVYLSGTNALTMDGHLVNLDKNGNRVAAMMFGPRQVYIVAGVNKICRTEDEARARTKVPAAVMNNIRFKNDTPCVETLTCVDCSHKNRLCYYTSIIHRSWPIKRIHVVLVAERLGF
ncbi:MAG: lactate utilization protein [Spirochaetota bacterium]